MDLVNKDYEWKPKQLDYATGLEIESAVRKNEEKTKYFIYFNR